MTRTTLDLDPTVLAALKKSQRGQDKSLGALASELLAQALAGPDPEPAPLRWTSRSMGLPAVDLEDKNAVWAVLDEG